jgi:hypothetical protein
LGPLGTVASLNCQYEVTEKGVAAEPATADVTMNVNSHSSENGR